MKGEEAGLLRRIKSKDIKFFAAEIRRIALTFRKAMSEKSLMLMLMLMLMLILNFSETQSHSPGRGNDKVRS